MVATVATMPMHKSFQPNHHRLVGLIKVSKQNSWSVQVIFNAEHVVRIRVLMLTTALRPFEGIADLYMVDPDGFIIRKWNSKGRLESVQGVSPMYLVDLEISP